eukprot:CAMPEP_0173416810 /NCGR_PEP_ID=MMETSP1356-20130122/85580_1 /TAXON_ID=77927 ORGANISM="Hemiselmis virescens, Strain PCC157" /NCGR_SAMPLE_ID=MMETSP1356 /ASSEMBLY_ACC=CAM_ASM_000847 /LENGTH=46 /DNA_ID= /DNA_START= /DNA_END= /DNA_ORIENTATION=
MKGVLACEEDDEEWFASRKYSFIRVDIVAVTRKQKMNRTNSAASAE